MFLKPATDMENSFKKSKISPEKNINGGKLEAKKTLKGIRITRP